MQPGVARLAALGAVAVGAQNGRSIAGFPLFTAGPKSGHGSRHARGIGEDDVEDHLGEWLAMELNGGEGDLHGYNGLGWMSVRRRQWGQRGE